jgi:molybdate transport system substrate-binding protein
MGERRFRTMGVHVNQKVAEVLGVLGACLALAACSPEAPPPERVNGEVVVFAAASLTEAFKEIAAAFEQAHPGARVTFNFGASSQLRAQLEQGARADVFASADQAQMDAARKSDVLAGPDRVFARNRLAIITPRDNPGGIERVQDLARDGVRLVTTEPSVPIGQYTLAMLARATADPVYGADFRARVERNIVSREANVRQLVSKVQLGEADAAVVYSSDVTPQVRDQVRMIAIPDELNTLASYPVALARGNNPAVGEAFARYLLSSPAQEVLARWGFVPVDR